mmetsp:Transcript_27701/g.79576  ORF Transcript_27701/g.79576 Transcript_27701/m.79576 type:complete len:347 (+) Transcript_27701:214-1254(+)
MVAAGAERKDAGARDSFWGTAGGAQKKAKAGDGGAAVRKEATRRDSTPAGDLLAAKTESQPVTPKRTEPPSRQEEKIEGKEIDDVFEDDDEDDDLVPEAQPGFPRNEIGKEVTSFRQNAVHVYGLDFLKTGHMDEIFSQFNHKFVEWINDSSANIIFADAASAKKALESLSFPKTGDDPWRRTPDILVSEDVPPIFLQMRLAASTDSKPSKRSVPSPAAATHFTRPQRRENISSMGRRMRSDGPDAAPQAPSSAKRPKKAEITEEELQKRRKRAERFGVNQPASGRPAEPPQAAAKPETSSTDAATSGTASKQGVPQGDGGSDSGKAEPAPGQAIAPAEQAASSEA